MSRAAKTGHRPRKRFGQHFLCDEHYIERLVDSIAPKAGQRLVEIGPGQGALTRPLLARVDQLDVVELDRDLIPGLRALAHSCGSGTHTLTIHEADALKFDFCPLVEGMPKPKLRVVGNLPYNISTPLLFHLTRQLACIEDMHFMLQKEVVERITAPAGGGSYGRLTVMLSYYCQSEYLFTVPPGAFQPPPRVDSAIVRLIPHASPPADVGDTQVFAELVNQAFSQRRKTLRNSLKNLLDASAIESAGVDPTLRPECLSLSQFAALSRKISENRA